MVIISLGHKEGGKDRRGWVGDRDDHMHTGALLIHLENFENFLS